MIGMRIFWALFMGSIVGLCFRRSQRYELRPSESRWPERDAVVYASPMALPFVLLALTATFLVFVPELGSQMVQFIAVNMALTLTLYFALLLMLLPLLRRLFSARACATLWLLPVFIYYPSPQVVLRFAGETPWVLRVPESRLRLIAFFWLAGAVLLLLRYTVSHVLFRRAVLREARPMTDREILAIWEGERRSICLKKPVPLYISPYVSTPMTVGIFRRRMRTLLPERDYSHAQLELIFRHELKHIMRRDVETKAFLIFCRAVCWFNPLVWLATLKAAADLELSCDEAVLRDADESARREYAGLLLSTAGDGRGLTTCLSAAAGTLRRRLSCVVSPGARASGTALIILVMALLIMCSGAVGVSTVYGSLEEVFFSQTADISRIDRITLDGAPELGATSTTEFFASDAGALLRHISALPVTRVIDSGVHGKTEGPRLFIDMDLENGGFMWVDISDKTLITFSPIGGKMQKRYYLLDAAPDWEYIVSCLSIETGHSSE